jgi:CheY-like chemotaxis protein
MNDPPASDPADSPTVLVVEDDLPVLQMATHILGSAGCTVLSARSAEEALDAFAQGPDVSLLFSDVVLPGRDGLDLADALVARRPDLRVLITTGQRTADIHARIQRSGHPFLAKPYTANALRDAVRDALALDGGSTQSP